MSKLWFERTFDFSFPAELSPNILARLRGTPARLEELLRGGDPATLIAKASALWSAQEQAGHLGDMEPLWLARVDDYAAGRDELTIADLQNRKTTEAGHNDRPLEDILRQFRTQRARLLQHVQTLDTRPFTRTLPHPRMRTPMRLVDHLYFVAEHDDHHLARIFELL